MNSIITRIIVSAMGLWLVFGFTAVLGANVATAEQVVPGHMATNLTRVTPEMIAKITQACPAEPAAQPEKPRKILIFSRTENFTHDSISVAEKALTILGEKTGAFSADISYDYGVFDAGKLAAYDAIILNNAQQLKIPAGAAREALLDFVRGGKGVVLIHSAVSNFDDFPEAKAMVGGAGAGHPWGHYFAWRFKVEEPKHPITSCFDPAGFSMKDEQYQYDQNNTGRQNVRVLMSMDMSDPATAKDDKGKQRGFRTDGFNPVVWVRQAGKGRVFVNGFGHNKEGYWDSRLLKLNLAGIQYAIGDLKADDAIQKLPNP